MRDPNYRDPGNQTIPYTLVDQAATVGDDAWLISGSSVYTFHQANVRSNELAAGFRAIGIEAGSRVGIFMDNCFEFVFAVMALGKLGAVWIPVNTAYKGQFLRRTLADSDAELLIVDADLLERVELVLDGAPKIKRLVVRGRVEGRETGIELHSLDELPVEGAGEQLSTLPPDTPYAVLYTSGTTGPSKGVVMSHHYWYSVIRAEFEVRDVQDGDRWFHPVPMFHGSVWLHTVMPALITGTTAVGVEDRFSASQFLERVRLYGATQIVSIGAMHMFILGQPERPDDADNSARVWTPVPLPLELQRPFMDRFGVERLIFYYGQTECMIIAQGNSQSTPGAAGWPRKDLEVKVLDSSDREAPAGEVGEISIRPKRPYLMFDGYYNNAQATTEAFRNLWHHTGDLGRFNEAGELFWVDRKQDYLRRRGENISSFEIEAAVSEHPAVQFAVAHAVPSESTEDELKICVVLVPGAELSYLELAQFCNEHLPYFAVPRYIELMALEDLPVTASNRPQKYILRERGVTPATWDAVDAGFDVTR